MSDLNEQVIGTTQQDYVDINLSPLNSDMASIFSPLASEEYGNSAVLYYDNSFYQFAPPQYYSYLWRVERRMLWWYRGFVPGLHNHSVLSTKLARRVCKRLAELTISGGFRVEGFQLGVEFIEGFNKRNKVKTKLAKVLPMLNATGRCLAKLDFRADNSLSLNFLDSTKYFSVVDNELNVTQFVALVAFIPPEIISTLSSTDRGYEGYFLVEHRKLSGARAYQTFKLYRAQSTMSSPIFGNYSEVVNDATGYVQSRVAHYLGGNVELNKVYQLPFLGHLGAQVILNSSASSGIDESGFSDSSLFEATEELAHYDITNTQKQGNKYLAQTGVLVPDDMIPPEIASNPNGNAQAAWLANQRSLDTRVYKKVAMNGSTAEANKPVFFQAENQSSTYNEDLKEIEANIATLCGLTPTALAGHLTANGNRTATEVVNEDNLTRDTIEAKRDLIAEPLLQLYKWVLEYYEIKDEIGMLDSLDVVFNSSVLKDPASETEDLCTQVNNKILSRRTAIAKRNKNFNKEEVEEELKRIDEDIANSPQPMNPWIG